MSSGGLRAVSCCTYLTSTDSPWRSSDWTASKGVKLLKGDQINGHFDITLKGKPVKITNENKSVWTEQAVPRRMAEYLARAYPGPISLVPIPNSTTTEKTRTDFRILGLARLIADLAGPDYTVCPAIVFKDEQVSSRKGGPRSPYHFEQAYSVLKRPKKNVVLIDDVLTSGGHLVGAAWKLQSEGITVVGALTFGRSTREQVEPVFMMHEETLSLAKTEADF